MANFEYEIFISADKEEVFSALTNPFQIELWSGYPADMSDEIGKEFSIWDGDICGKNIEVKKPGKLVQEWYFEGEEKRSIVQIEIKQNANESRIKLRHTNIPDEVYDEICKGWKEYYLGSIKDFLEMY